MYDSVSVISEQCVDRGDIASDWDVVVDCLRRVSGGFRQVCT